MNGHTTSWPRRALAWPHPHIRPMKQGTGFFQFHKMSMPGEGLFAWEYSIVDGCYHLHLWVRAHKMSEGHYLGQCAPIESLMNMPFLTELACGRPGRRQPRQMRYTLLLSTTGIPVACFIAGCRLFWMLGMKYLNGLPSRHVAAPWSVQQPELETWHAPPPCSPKWLQSSLKLPVLGPQRLNISEETGFVLQSLPWMQSPSECCPAHFERMVCLRHTTHLELN